MTGARIQACGLSLMFGPTRALDQVSLVVPAGQFVTLLGASGAGKTSLVRLLAGGMPTLGHVLLDGEPLLSGSRETQRLRRRRIGVVSQQFGLVARLSALDNVLAGRVGFVPGWRAGLRWFSHDDRLRALGCLDRVGLMAQAGQRADTLSGGQQQRVALARVLAQAPEVILADEPVASVDPRMADELLTLLRTIGRDDKVTVICSLHQPELARRHADRIVAMRAGRIVADGPADSFDDDALQRLYRQQPGVDALQRSGCA